MFKVQLLTDCTIYSAGDSRDKGTWPRVGTAGDGLRADRKARGSSQQDGSVYSAGITKATTRQPTFCADLDVLLETLEQNRLKHVISPILVIF